MPETDKTEVLVEPVEGELLAAPRLMRESLSVVKERDSDEPVSNLAVTDVKRFLPLDADVFIVREEVEVHVIAAIRVSPTDPRPDSFDAHRLYNEMEEEPEQGAFDVSSPRKAATSREIRPPAESTLLGSMDRVTGLDKTDAKATFAKTVFVSFHVENIALVPATRDFGEVDEDPKLVPDNVIVTEPGRKLHGQVY